MPIEIKKNSVFKLLWYTDGRITKVQTYTDLSEVMRVYSAAYVATGVAPRLLIDDERVPIVQADALMLESGSPLSEEHFKKRTMEMKIKRKAWKKIMRKRQDDEIRRISAKSIADER